MATSASLVVEIRTKAQQFNRDIDAAKARAKSMGQTAGQDIAKGVERGTRRAGQSIQSFANNALRQFRRIGLAVTAAFTAVGAVAAVNMRKAANEIDKLAKNARRLDIAVESLQRLNFAAREAGVSQEQLTRGLSRLNRMLGDAQNGSQAAASAFGRLGLRVDDLVRMDPEERFIRISRALAQVSSATERASIAQQIFGVSARQLLPLIQSDVQKTGQEFDKLGLTISQSQSQAIEEMNDQVGRVSAIWSGMWGQVTAEVAPAFTEISVKIQEFVKEMGGIKPIALDVARVTIRSFRGIVTVLDSVIQSFGFLSAMIRSREIARLSDEIEGTTRALEAMQKAQEAGIETIEAPGRDPVDVRKAVQVNKDRLNFLKDEISALKEQEEIYRNSTSMLSKAADILSKHEGEIEKSQRAQERVRQVSEQTMSVSESIGKIWDSNGKALEFTAQKMKEIEQTAQNIASIQWSGDPASARTLSGTAATAATESARPTQKIELGIRLEEGVIVDLLKNSENFEQSLVDLVMKETNNQARRVTQ